MMRYLKILFLILAVICFTGGGAWAVTELDIAAGVAVDVDVDAVASGPYVVGSEWLAGQAGVVSVDLGSAVPSPGVAPANRSNILYVPAIAIGVDNTIVITVTNGALAPSAAYGLYDLTADQACANLVDFTADGAGNYTRLVLKFLNTEGVLFPSVNVGAILALTEDGGTPIPGNKPVLRFTNAQLTAGNMTLQVTNAYDSTALPLTAPLTAAEVVAKRLDQLSAKVQNPTAAGVYADGWATSVIDVEAITSRTKFVVEADKDTPNNVRSTAAILVASAVVNNGVDLATAAYTITLNGDQSAILTTTGVKLEATNFTRTAGVSWTLSSTFAANNLRTPTANDILIEVNGTTVIDIATYTVTLVIDPAEVGVANKTALNGATAFVWTVNAMQARIPYLVIDTRASGVYSSFLEITNRGSLSAKVSIDAIISNADGTLNSTETQNNVLTVPANSVTIIRQTDLDTWFVGIDNTQLYRVALLLTIVAPQNTVDITAYHISPNSRTSATVLYNTNNADDGRVWQ